MRSKDEDLGTILALVKRFRTQRLPRAQAIKDKLDNGGLLDDNDRAFLQQVRHDAHHIKPLVHRNPEWRSYVAEAAALYRDITFKALANEAIARAKKP